GHGASVFEDEPGRDRDDEQGQRGELQVHQRHDEEGADEGHDGDEDIFGAVMGDLAHILEVLGHMGDQMSGLGVVEITEGELVEMVERLAAHVGLDADPQRVAPIVDDGQQDGVEQVNDQQSAGGGQNPEPVLAGQKLVDIELDDDREAELEQAHDHRAAEIEDKQALVGGIIGKETAQHVGRLLGRMDGPSALKLDSSSQVFTRSRISGHTRAGANLQPGVEGGSAQAATNFSSKA